MPTKSTSASWHITKPIPATVSPTKTDGDERFDRYSVLLAGELANHFIETDGTPPLLVPRFTLGDKSVLMPLAFIRHVAISTGGGAAAVTYDQSEMDRLGEESPVADDRLAVATTYVMARGKITRTDIYSPKAPLDIAGIRLEFGSFSTDPALSGTDVHFGNGAVTGFKVTGLDGCAVQSLAQNHDYESDTGPMKTLVACSGSARTVSAPFTISWTLTYCQE